MKKNVLIVSEEEDKPNGSRDRGGKERSVERLRKLITTIR